MADQQNGNSDPGKRPPSTRAELAIAWFTFALLAVAIVAAIATGLQWNTAEEALNFASESAAETGNQTQAALAISDRIAQATEDQARVTELAFGQTKRIASANERSVSIAESDLRLKRVSDLDIGAIAHGIRGPFWDTDFQISPVGSLPIREASVVAHAGWYTRDQIDKFWSERKPSKAIDFVPGHPHTITLHVPRRPDEIREMGVDGIVAITAVEISFTDANGDRQVRRGCRYYSGDAQVHSCDNN